VVATVGGAGVWSQEYLDVTFDDHRIRRYPLVGYDAETLARWLVDDFKADIIDIEIVEEAE
jgi:hypothetical protein